MHASRGSSELEDITMELQGSSASKPDPRQRLAVPLFRAIGPLVRLALRHGLAGPNVLVTVRGRVTGRPHSTPVAMWELGERRFVQASFGEVNWVRNLRASGEAVIGRGRWEQPVRAIELAPDDAGQLIHDALADFRRVRLLRVLLGPTVRPPVAILHRYRFRVDDRLEDDVAEARRHPLFELVSQRSVAPRGARDVSQR
jgi:deazaflavin-dependent oxidoreductase (nitroreductase family)